MIKYIITNGELFQYPRTPTEHDKYCSRSKYGPDIEKARIFNTKSSATNSLNYKNGSNSYRYINDAPPKGLKVVPVRIKYELVEE